MLSLLHIFVPYAAVRAVDDLIFGDLLNLQTADLDTLSILMGQYYIKSK